MIFILFILSVLGLFTALASSYAVGKYNQLVTMRHRILTGMLQLDFALRKQSAELRTLVNDPARLKVEALPPTDFFSRLDRAEESAHMAVSGPLCDGNLAELAAAEKLMASCWNAMLMDARNDMARHARNRLESNAETWDKIVGLVVHYSHRARKLPCRWIASASAFETLTATNFLSGKFLPPSRSAP